MNIWSINPASSRPLNKRPAISFTQLRINKDDANAIAKLGASYGRDFADEFDNALSKISSISNPHTVSLKYCGGELEGSYFSISGENGLKLASIHLLQKPDKKDIEKKIEEIVKLPDEVKAAIEELENRESIFNICARYFPEAKDLTNKYPKKEK